MAIALDNTANSGVLADQNTSSISIVVGTLTDGIIVVGTQIRDASSSDAVVTGISSDLDGAFTKVRADIFLGGANFGAELWYLLAPSAGTHAITVTHAGSIDELSSGAISLSGVDQTNPINVHNGRNGTNQSSTVNVTTTVDNCWLVDSIYQSDNNDMTPSDTQIFQLGVNGNGDRSGMQYDSGATPAGSHGVTWTWVQTGQGNGHSALALAPTVEAPEVVPYRSMMGVGL